MEQPKSNVGTLIIAIVLTAVIVGSGVYFWQKNQTIPSEKAVSPVVTVEKTDPISYSTTGVAATVSTETKPFGYTADQLKSMADECGSAHATGYFDQLVKDFSETSNTVYNFKYQDESQRSGTYTVTVTPNVKGYTSLDAFKKDFDICAAGGYMYPKMVNKNWLLFQSSCGSGFNDGSGRPNGCQKVQDVVEPTLRLN